MDKYLKIFIEKSKKIHNSKYDYSLVKYVNNTTKVKIICPVHGVFEQTPASHLNGSECPHDNNSYGETKIFNILKNKNLCFETQKRFKDCKDKRTLPFDFYLPDYNLCIEYDGRQHFESVEIFGGEQNFQIQQKHDKIKNNFCKENNIDLLRIKYTDDIEEKLNEKYNEKIYIL